MDIQICSKREATGWLKSPRRSHTVKGLISIGRNGETYPCGFGSVICPKLRLEFSDIDDTEIPEPEFNLFPPTRKDVEEIIKFGQRLDWNQEGNLIVHCAMGVSRSAATAYVLSCIHLDNPEGSWNTLKKTFPRINPNALIIHHAGQILNEDLTLPGWKPWAPNKMITQ